MPRPHEARGQGEADRVIPAMDASRPQRVAQDDIYVAIKPNGTGFKVSMDGVTGKADFASLLDAKMLVVETIKSGEAAQFLAQCDARLASQPNGRKQCQAGLELS